MKHELLAPAGNLEAGYAALHYGADAVYLGLTKFSARANAENFSLSDLDALTAYAHSINRKVFVALNTILTEEEIKELPEMITELKKRHVDALIVQDLGVAYIAQKLAPEIELHASTQMAVHNVEGAKFLQSLGFKRVVLARELSLNEIKEIKNALPDLDLEVFIHGALCYSYSGQCLFSALEFGKSANRGRCVYPCRAAYKNNTATEHLFSMKDLALEQDILKIPALSLKIEGRKKSPLYVAAVTNYYRHILDNKKLSDEADDIKQIFSRPWCKFHLNGKDKALTDLNFVGHRGLLIGQVENVKKQHLIFTPNHKIARYDGLQIDIKGDEKPFGFGIKNLFINKKSVYESKKDELVEVELPENHPHIEIGAPIYLASSSAIKGKYDYTKPKPNAYHNQTPLSLKIEITSSEISAMCEQKAALIKGNFEPSKQTNNTDTAIQKSFSKTGDYPFFFNKIEIINPENLFIPISMLNELRRLLAEQLITNESETKLTLPEIKPCAKAKSAKEINIIELDFESKAEEFSPTDLNKTWFRLPMVCRNTTRLDKIIQTFYTSGARHFIAENYYAFELLKKYPNIKIGAGHFLYVMNSYATEMLKQMGAVFATFALESNHENMQQIIAHSALPMIQVIKAHPPLFTSAVCIRKGHCKDCNKQEKTWQITSQGRKYKVISKFCQTQVFSEVPYESTPIDGISGYYISPNV